MAFRQFDKCDYRKYQPKIHQLYALSKNTINQLNLIAAQTKEDARRFNFFVDKNIFITGNMKFDREVPQIQRTWERSCELSTTHYVQYFAASTIPGRECIQAIQQIKNIPIF